MDCQPLLPLLSISTLDGGKKIIVHNSHEVLVPDKEIKSQINQLHSTHMATETMIRLAKGKFIWPGMKTDIGENTRTVMNV